MDTFYRLKKHFIFLLFLSIGLSVFTATQSHMNNWLIFKASYSHLMNGTSLYIHYPGEHDDLFKYSPTFALLMAPFSYLPAWLGATLWNFLGALLFILALIKLPITDRQRKGIFWISLPEFIGSTQGFQSNIHMVSFLFLFWVALESKDGLRASVNLLSSFFIKIFGVLGGCLIIYEEYWKKKPAFLLKLILVGMLSLAILLFLPLPFIGMTSLEFQYVEWMKLLKMDAAQSYGFSLMGVIHGFTGWKFDRLPFQMAGGISLMASILWFRKGDQQIRMLGLISLCYFLILFNHKSESPTFIIAMMAFGLHQSMIKNKKVRWGLIVFTLGCVSLLYSDLFRHYKQSVFDVYSVKAWPFIVLYPLSLTGLFFKKKTPLAHQRVY